MWLPDKTETIILTGKNLGENVKQELTVWPDRRIDAILIECYSQLTVAAGPAVWNADGMLNLVRNIRLNVQTAKRGLYAQTDVHGPSLIDLMRNQAGWNDRQTLQYYDYQPTANGNYLGYMNYLVPIRNLQMGDPAGLLTSLPLNIVKTKPLLEIQLASAAELATNLAQQAATTVTLIVTILYRDEAGDPKAGQYLPSDLITHADSKWTDSRFLIPPDGLITNLACRFYNNSALDSGFNLFSSTERLQLRRGSEVLNDEPPLTRMFLSDFSAKAEANGNATSAKNTKGFLVYDKLCDIFGVDAAAPTSCLDVNVPANMAGGASANLYQLVPTKLAADVGAGKVVKHTTQRIMSTMSEARVLLGI